MVFEPEQNGLEVWLKQSRTCSESKKSWVKTPVPPKKKKKKKKKKIIILWGGIAGDDPVEVGRG
jgi:hypothetical protein